MSHQPYSVTVPDLQVELDASSAFLTHCYRNALDRLNRSFGQNRPVAILLGEGQSTCDFVIRAFLSGLDEDTAVARVTEPCADATDLLRKIICAAGFEPKEMNLGDLESIFTMFLAFQKSHGRRTVVCLEGLQDSEWWVLDKIRSLVEMEVESQYGMLVLISGQPALKELLNNRPLNSVATLAGYRISLAPFTLSETTECIRQRVEAAGSATVGQVFQYQAITLIHELCAGVPDAITSLVDQCLHMAGQDGVDLVTTMTVKRAYEASRAAMEPQEGDPDARTVEVSKVKLPMRRLIVRLTGDDVREQSLRQGHTLIGRSRLCDVRINSPTVSRHHALINYSGEGAMLVDLGSTNGTCVDGYQISAHTLEPGETISVGNCNIEYIVYDELQTEIQKSVQSDSIELNFSGAKNT